MLSCGNAENLVHLPDVFHPIKAVFKLFGFYLADLITNCTRRSLVNLTQAVLERQVWRKIIALQSRTNSPVS